MSDNELTPKPGKAIDKRTAVYKELSKSVRRRRNEVVMNIDGVEIRYKKEPRCKTCTAGERNLKNAVQVQQIIDYHLVLPSSYAYILNIIQPLMEDWPDKYKPSFKSIATHAERHLPWEQAALRKIVEKHAARKGLSMFDATNDILTEEAWLEATAKMGWKRLAQGDIEPNWTETQKAFERLDSLRAMGEGTISITELVAQLNAIISAVRDEVPPDLWPTIMNKVQGLNVNVTNNYYSPQESEEVVDGEVTDELEEILEEQENFLPENKKKEKE